MDIKPCPKCGYKRTTNDKAPEYECPACGIVYEKFLKPQSVQKPTKDNNPPNPNWLSQRLSQVSIAALVALVTLLSMVWVSDKRTDIRSPAATQEATSEAFDTNLENPRTEVFVIELEDAIQAANKRVAELQAEYDKYSGGLIRSLLGASLAAEHHTLAMLNQKKQSWLHRIALTYTVDGKTFTPASDTSSILAELDAEIEVEKAKLLVTGAKADLYSGGLVRATLLSAAATTELSLSLLEQKRASLKFGFPLYDAGQGSDAPSKPISNSSPERPQPQETLKWAILNIDSRVTESNSSWQKYAWRLELENGEDYPLVFNATIEFQDSDGFIIDTDREYGLHVPANSSKVFTGSTLINVPGAYRVAKTYAKAALK